MITTEAGVNQKQAGLPELKYKGGQTMNCDKRNILQILNNVQSHQNNSKAG